MARPTIDPNFPEEFQRGYVEGRRPSPRQVEVEPERHAEGSESESEPAAVVLEESETAAEAPAESFAGRAALWGLAAALLLLAVGTITLCLQYWVPPRGIPDNSTTLDYWVRRPLVQQICDASPAFFAAGLLALGATFTYLCRASKLWVVGIFVVAVIGLVGGFVAQNAYFIFQVSDSQANSYGSPDPFPLPHLALSLMGIGYPVMIVGGALLALAVVLATKPKWSQSRALTVTGLVLTAAGLFMFFADRIFPAQQGSGMVVEGPGIVRRALGLQELLANSYFPVLLVGLCALGAAPLLAKAQSRRLTSPNHE